MQFNNLIFSSFKNQDKVRTSKVQEQEELHRHASDDQTRLTEFALDRAKKKCKTYGLKFKFW